MEENWILTGSSEKSPGVTSVKKFVQDFEHRIPIFREENGQGDAVKKRETMTTTSFRKLHDLKKNLEQSMHQRYQSNKNIQKVGKPISELKEALKKSMDNLSSGSFTCKSYTPVSAVRLRNKGSCDYLNQTSTPVTSSFLNSRRFSLGSTKFKPIPLPKPKTSFKAKKYKSISDLCDTRESVIVENIEFNGTNDVFENSKGVGDASRLSCDLLNFPSISKHSETFSELSTRSPQHSNHPSEVFNDSSDISNRNSIFSSISSSSTFRTSPNQSPHCSTESCMKHRKSLIFEPIGETCTDDLEEAGCDHIIIENIHQEAKKEITFDLIGEALTDDIEYNDDDDDETLHSTNDLDNFVPFYVDSNASESSENDDAMENGTYYISREDLTNSINEHITESHFPVEIDTNSGTLTAEINSEVKKNLTNFSLETPPPLIQSTFPSDDTHETNSETCEEEQPPSLIDSTNNQAITQLSTKKPCLKVSPLQNTQASPSQQLHSNEQVPSFEATKSSPVSPSINASPIINQALCQSIHSYFHTLLKSLSLQTDNQSDLFDLEILSNLFTNPLSGFDRISDVFSIQYHSSDQPAYNHDLQNSSKVSDCL